MVRIRRSRERGHFDHGWLDTRHTFSFGRYHDPRHMGFRVLRVINEDWIQPGRGFPTHPHRDMEIITYVVEGALEHRDSTGNGSVIRPGEVQRMTAGTGITHSEMNPSRKEPVHLLQIWIQPDRAGHPPSYEQKSLPLAEQKGRLRLLASPDGRGGSVRMNQQAWLWGALLEAGQRVAYTPGTRRHVWIQVVKGRLALSAQGEDHALEEGDGAAIGGGGGGSAGTREEAAETRVLLTAREGAELLLFDLP